MTARRIVVVGAGGSGVPLAARLAEAGHEVVLLEAGTRGDLPDDEAALRDAWTVRAGLPDGALVWTYDAELFVGRPWRIARGRVLGGSTSVNGAYFQRPHPSDFAGWAEAAGAEWSYEACLPALMRLEDDRDFGDRPVHGSAGPVPVERAGADDAITTAFLAAAYDAGAAHEEDKNGGGASGAGLLPRNAHAAQRWGVARAYAGLLGAVDVRTDAAAQRVVFRGDTAVGVEVRVAGAVEVIAADEVIVCAGAIETPRLLLRSGIGDAAALPPDVEIVAPLRGVGRALSDHPALDLAWEPRAGALSADLDAAWTAAWNAPAGTVAASAVEYLLAAKPTAVILTGDAAATGPLDLRVTLAQPTSRGVVTPALVRYDYLSTAADRAALRDAARTALDLLRSPQMAEIVASVALPPWADAAGSDDAVDAWVRDSLGTALHSCGTARMGEPDDPDAVADAHGRVHRIRSLRIADASLLPAVPTRGTALTAVLIGERIAELIAAE